MISYFQFNRFLIFLMILFSFSCRFRHNKNEIEAAMKHYDHLIQNMDADSISMIYTVDGDLGIVAHGRDSIRKFLSSFKNVRVLSNFSKTKSITIDRDTAIQTGSYQQWALVSQKDTVKVQGEFSAKWIWLRKEGWKLKKMETTSL